MSILDASIETLYTPLYDNFLKFFYTPSVYYVYITLFWIIFLISLFFVLKKLKLDLKRKDYMVIACLAIIIFLAGPVFYRHYFTYESSPFNTMSVCMSDLSNIYLNNDICKKSYFGDLHEVAWPALISYAHRLFGISFLNNFFLMLIINFLTSMIIYITFIQIFSRIKSFLVVILLFSIPLNVSHLFSTSKEPLYNLFLALCFLIFVKFKNFESTKDFLLFGILFAFFPEEKIQFIVLFPIFIYFIYLRFGLVKETAKKIFVFLTPLILTFPYKLLILYYDRNANNMTPLLKEKLSYGFIMSLLKFIFNNVAFLFILSTVLTFVYLIYYQKREPFSRIKYLFYFTILYNILTVILYLYSNHVHMLQSHHITNITFTFWIQFILSFTLIFRKKASLIAWAILVLLMAHNLNSLYEYPNSNLRGIKDDSIFNITKRFNEYANLLNSHVANSNPYFIKEDILYHNYEYMYIKGFQEYSIKGLYDSISTNNVNLYSDNLRQDIQNCNDLIFFGKEREVERVIETIQCYMDEDKKECVKLLYAGNFLYRVCEDNSAFKLIVNDLESISKCEYGVVQFNSAKSKITLVKFSK